MLKAKNGHGAPRLGQRKHVVVAGLIGIGKTTLTQALVDTYPSEFLRVTEPVDEWQKSGYLDAFYKDSERYALSFQQFAFLTRIKQFEKIKRQAEKSAVMRCIPRFVFDSHFVMDPAFVTTLKDEGKITSGDCLLYDHHKKHANLLVPEIERIDYFFFLDSGSGIQKTVDLSMDRIKERSRGEEVGIERDYLLKLQTNFEHVYETLPKTVIKMKLNATESIAKNIGIIAATVGLKP
jgi:deoxyadenosine/deoxycytidine kinase